MWFFAAGRDLSRSESDQTPAITNIPFTTGDEQTRLEGKLTVAATEKHNVVGSYIKIDQSATNVGSFTFIDLDSLNPKREDPQEIKAFNYNGILTSNFFVEAQYSERDYTIGIGSGGPRDLLKGTLWRQPPLRRALAHADLLRRV